VRGHPAECSSHREGDGGEPHGFEHPSVNRSLLSYEIGKDRSMTAILHVEPSKSGTVESELADAIVQFMRSRGDIDRAEVSPRNPD
jgi:hypothetical protein